MFHKTGTSQVGAISKAQKARSFKNCKGGDPLVGFFESPVCCKISKNEGGTFGDYKKFSKKNEERKMRILKNLIVPKNSKWETLWRRKNSKKSRTVPKN